VKPTRFFVFFKKKTSQQCKDEEARSDFEVAAGLGSALAKQEVVLLNPHAKLCSEMVALMFQEFHKQNV
jgi:hypothetical protein